jgi:hypothetical protein
MDSVYCAWESVVYPDGGKYEGLMKDGQAHGRGIYLYPQGTSRRCLLYDHSLHAVSLFAPSTAT